MLASANAEILVIHQQGAPQSCVSDGLKTIHDQFRNRCILDHWIFQHRWQNQVRATFNWPENQVREEAPAAGVGSKMLLSGQVLQQLLVRM